MVQKHSMPPKINTARPSTSNMFGKSNALLDPFCILQESSTTSCLLVSAPLVLNRPTPQKQPQRQSTNYSNTLPHIRMKASTIVPVTWCSVCILTLHTSIIPDPPAAQTCISPSSKMTLSRDSTVQSLPSPKSSSLSCLRLPKWSS